MPAPPSQTALLIAATPDEVEAHFYEALREADIDKLMALWFDDDDIVCVHPGGPRVVGARAIRASFEAIFERGGIPVRPGQVRRVHTPEAAVHHLIETVTLSGTEGAQHGYVAATNVYLKTALGWRLAAHHASQGASEPHEPPVDAPTTLH